MDIEYSVDKPPVLVILKQKKMLDGQTINMTCGMPLGEKM
jgi:hypothetical protein